MDPLIYDNRSLGISRYDTPDHALWAISSPGLTKLMGWSCDSERYPANWESNLMLVHAFHTQTQACYPLNPREIGCLLELKLYRDEAIYWEIAQSKSQYLGLPRSTDAESVLAHPNKLLDRMG